MRMPSVVSTGLAHLRRRLAWSNSPQSWRERASVLVVLAGAGALWRFRPELPPSVQVLFGGLLLAALALFLRRGWVKVFGPVFFYDLVRLGRRGRYFLLRTLYAGGLLALLGWVYLIWLMDNSNDGAIRANDMAEFAGSFFYMFIAVQFAVVVVLTPGYVAGSIAEEKDRKTLEFLLATDLRNREIVLSKVTARLLNLLMIVLTGLPILSLLQFLGGVDPNLVLAGFAATGMTMASLAGLSILCSVWARRPRDAIAFTYLLAAAYLILSGMSWLLLVPSLGLAQLPSTQSWASPVTVEDLVKWFNAGNPVSAFVLLSEAIDSGGRLDDLLPVQLWEYVLFNGLVALVCTTWAVLRMRPVALRQLQGPANGKVRRRRHWHRPRPGNQPMLWKELFAEPSFRLNRLIWAVLVLLILVSFVPFGCILWAFISEWLTQYSNAFEDLAEATNIWVRAAGTPVACLLLLAVAVRASNTFSGERDRQTYDSLLTSPLECSSILFAKWLGSIASVRWAALWLLAIWVLGVAAGGLHVLAVPLLATAWLVFAAVVASLGTWFSLVSQTSLRATVWTLLATVAASVGHWLLTLLCIYIPVGTLVGSLGEDFHWLPEFEFYGLTPPATLALLALHGGEFGEHFFWNGSDFWRWVACAGAGLAVWATVAGCVWVRTLGRFRVLAGRMPLRRPVVPRAPAEAPAAEVRT
jgi:ABC-type transport system involved in multi-copper enzyme maturation permease subunit